MHHSFTKFNRNIISPTALFLAAKVEEQPRKLEHVIKVVNACLHPHEPQLDTKCDVGQSQGFKDNQMMLYLVICYIGLTGLLLSTKTCV